ncbi:MAG: hypothetical protein BWY94_02448 [Actinobacteria bacterium ADurb.BinA094]|nr:MAG: hypothetical protein BWY94_02448 [Actinobacteria bacterium ADurb.BinA094]
MISVFVRPSVWIVPRWLIRPEPERRIRETSPTLA